MALEWPRQTDQPQAVGLVADRRLCLTADQMRVVEPNDPAAAWLLAAPGTLIEKPEVERLGLVVVDGRLTQRAAMPDVVKVVEPVLVDPDVVKDDATAKPEPVLPENVDTPVDVQERPKRGRK